MEEIYKKYLQEKYPNEPHLDILYEEWLLIGGPKRKWFKRWLEPPKEAYLYLTLSPDKFKRNLTDYNRLQEWAHLWFTSNNKHYKGGVWVAEVGSKGDHGHIHCLLKMANSSKHAYNLKRSWARFFPDSELLTSLNLCASGASGTSNRRGEYCYANITDPKIAKDKLEYFVDSCKGSHQNAYVLMEPLFFGEMVVA